MKGIASLIVSRLRCVEPIPAGEAETECLQTLLRHLGDHSGRTENRELRPERREQMTTMTLSRLIGMDGDFVHERADGRLAPIDTPIGSEPEKATMQLLHQT